MKKRILATILAVAMVFSVCTLASADESDVAYFQDFSDAAKATEWTDAGFSIVDGAAYNSIAGWPYGTVNLISGVSADETYTIIFKFQHNWTGGDVKFGPDNMNFWANERIAAHVSTNGKDPGEWMYFATKVTGYDNYVMISSGERVLYDDILVIKGDQLEMCEAWINDETKTNPYSSVSANVPPVSGEQVTTAPGATTAPSATPSSSATAAPTTGATTAPSATVAPSVTPSSSATAAPSASPSTGTTTPKKKVTIKFKKKSVKIKKGKKATLKVTIKNAKKATFSVDKKGKKVVKLSKKKAKSVVVTGKKKGKATITAKAAGKKATCKVTVK